MLRLSVILLFLHLFNAAYSQNAWIFETSDDFLNNKSRQTTLTQRAYTSVFKNDISALLYTFTSDDEKINEDIKHYYFAIVYGDSVYINCEPFTDRQYYANVIMNNKKYMYFVTVPGKREYNNGKIIPKEMIPFTGVVPYLIVNAAVDRLESNQFDDAPPRPQKTNNGYGYSYIYNMETKMADILTPDVLENMLVMCPALKDMYVRTGRPHSNYTYYYYLNRLFNME